MVCGRCGESNRDGARFCASCGDPLNARCATCDAELAPGARFCDACGAPVAVANEQARKTVTVVFADLAGSTSMQERMDPESVRAFNARCYATMRAAVERHDGRLVKFVGDGMMAVFGVPEVREDDATRALATAADLRDELDGLRIGVNTGEVVVEGGDDDVVGDAVNVAARLEAAAPVGGVLVGAETYRLTRDHAEFGDAEELHVKGRHEPVVARLLTSLHGRDDDRGAVAFVGRDQELARLVGALGTAEALGNAQLVTVIGSPGVGKSRLLGELEATVRDAATVLVGRCHAAGGPTFAPIADVVAGAVEVAGGVDDDVAAAVAFVVGDGTPGSPEQTCWGVRRTLEAAARVRPLLVVLDDLHWAEPLLLDLVEHLAEGLRHSPVVLVAAARPELREQRASLVDVGARPSLVLSLEGLDADATRLLASELLGAGELPPDVARRVVDATEGNPLYVRELVRMLIDDGVLQAAGDGWRLTVDAADIDVPPTISSLLAARIERLRADERTVLERASVIGHEVLRGALVHLLAHVELDPVLESLRRKELLEPAGTYWIDEPVLRFHHALIRDAAYRRVLREARAELHEKTAGWLIAKTGGGADHDETIGFHLEQAQANWRHLGELDDHGRAIAVEAARRLASAAHRSLHRDDLPAAGALAGRALACLDEGDGDRTELLLVRCEALLGTGAIVEARPAVEELATLAAGDERLGAWATAFDVQLATLMGTAELEDAGRVAQQAAERLSTLHDATGAAKAHRVHASVLARLGRIADTEAALDKALTAAREASDQRQISGVLAAAPVAALWGPSPVPRAGGRCLDVVRLLRITTGAREVEAISTRCQAVLESFRGRHDAARKMLVNARRTLEDLGLRHGLLELELAAGLVELAAGEAADADAHLQTAHEGFAALGVEVDAAQAAALQGRAALMLGDVDRAFDLAETAERLGGRDLKTAIAWRAVKAEVLARRGSHAEAVSLAQAAVSLAESTDALVDRADALAALGAVLRLTGDAAGAQAATDHARALYEQKGATALAERLGVGSPTAVPAATASRGATPGNLAYRAMFVGDRLMLAEDWEAYAERFHPDFVYEDRRPGLSTVPLGRDESIANTRVGRELGITDIEHEIVATRGDLAVLTASRVMATEWSVDSLLLVCCDAEGRSTRCLHFDPSQLDEAMAELDRLADAFPNENAAVRAARRGSALMLAGDWDGLRAAMHPDFVYEDRRSGLGSVVVGRDEQVANVRSSVELGVNGMDNEVVAVRGDRLALVRGRVTAGSYVVEALFITAVDDDGLTTAIVYFDASQLDEALAELDRRAAGAAPENAAVRAVAAVHDCVLRRDWNALRSRYAPGYVHHDRRSGIFRTGDADELVASYEQMGDATAAIDLEPVALHGDLLALVRMEYRAGSGFSVPVLTVAVADADERLVSTSSFDDGDVDAALVELDRLAHPGNRAVAWAATWLGSHDWEGQGQQAHPDFVAEDRRPGLRATYTRAQHLESLQAVAALRPRVSHRVVEAHGDGAALLAVALIGEHELRTDLLLVVDVDVDGLVRREILFDPESLDDARAALASRGPDAGDHPIVALQRWCDERVLAGDWDALASRLHPAMRFADRRLGVAVEYVGPDAHIENMRQVAGTGVARVDVQLVASAGERAAAMRLRVSDGRELNEVTFLGVMAVDDDGLITDVVVLDPDDVDTARAELDRLGRGRDDNDILAEALAREPDSVVLRAGVALTEAYNARDWQRLATVFTDDVVHVDHRRASFEQTVGLAATVERLSSVSVLASDITVAPRRIVSLQPGIGIAEISVGNASFRNDSLMLLQAGGDRLCRYEIFDVDDDAGALARMAELTGPSDGADGPVLAVRGSSLALVSRSSVGTYAVVAFEADASAVALADFEADHLPDALLDLDMRHGTPLALASARLAHGINTRDWEAVRAACSPDVVLLDRRTAGFGETVGIEASVARWRTLADVEDQLAFTRRFLDEREGIALSEVRNESRSRGLCTDLLCVMEAVGGVITRYELFDVADEGAARERLDELVRPAARQLRN